LRTKYRSQGGKVARARLFLKIILESGKNCKRGRGGGSWLKRFGKKVWEGKRNVKKKGKRVHVSQKRKGEPGDNNKISQRKKDVK